MSETKLDVTTPDGTAPCHLYRPDEGSGPWPGVLFFMDAGGVRPSMRQMAARLASSGYVVLLPNLYYRAGDVPPFDLARVWTDPTERERLMALMRTLDAANAMRDTAAYLDALGRQPGVRGERFGCVGYCMGGRLAFTAAGSLPERVAAAASIHGGHLVTDAPDSPHLQAARIRGRVYLGIADSDRSCTPEQQGQLVTALATAGVRYQAELYAGAQHGFAVPDAPVFDAAAAEQHWQRVTALFADALSPARA